MVERLGLRACLVLFLVLARLLDLPPRVHAHHPDPVPIIQAWLDAENAGNLRLAVAWFREDALVELVPGPRRYQGKPAIQVWMEQRVATRAPITATRFRAEHESASFVANLDRAEQPSRVDVILHEGRIKYVAVTSDSQAVAKLIAAPQPSHQPGVALPQPTLEPSASLPSASDESTLPLLPALGAAALLALLSLALTFTRRR